MAHGPAAPVAPAQLASPFKRAPAQLSNCNAQLIAARRNLRNLGGWFDAMDMDGSGKLNLGEILASAKRVQSLLMRARAYGAQH